VSVWLPTGLEAGRASADKVVRAQLANVAASRKMEKAPSLAAGRRNSIYLVSTASTAHNQEAANQPQEITATA